MLYPVDFSDSKFLHFVITITELSLCEMFSYYFIPVSSVSAPAHIGLWGYFISVSTWFLSQLIADYEEQGGQTYQPHNGDGASQSSAGTASPDIFQGGEPSSQFTGSKVAVSAFQPSDEHDVVVTSKDIQAHGEWWYTHDTYKMYNDIHTHGEWWYKHDT